MAIVSSGQISLLDIQTEFGGSPAININKFYAGGTLVPAGTVNVNNAAIPSSGQIALSDFYGAQQKPASFPVQVLILGGGGGGGPRWGDDYGNANAGAGAGGYIDAAFNLPKGSYSFTIGGGGGDGNGGDTVAFGYRAYGGGRGGGCDDQPGSSGGSGGGGAMNGGGGAGSNQPKPTGGNYGNQPAYGNSGSPNTGGAGGGGGAGNSASGTQRGIGRTWIDGKSYAYGGTASSAYGGNGYPGSSSGGTGGTYGNAGNGANQNGHGPRIPTYGVQGLVIVGYLWPTKIMSGGTEYDGGGTGYSHRWWHWFTSSSQTLTYS
jgi:hypothetical protein